MAPRWQEEQKQRLRQSLYETALELFRRRGYEQTTVEDITREVGVGKGTFFNYYPSKERVVVEWYRGIIAAALSAVEDREFENAEGAILALLLPTLEHALREPALLAIKSRIVVTSEPMARAEREQDRQSCEFILAHLRCGKERGELVAELDEARLATTLLRALTGTVHEWVLQGREFDLVEELRATLVYLLDAAKS